MSEDRITAERVAAFYERHPYPPPRDDLSGRVPIWDDSRRRAESHLFWTDQPYRDDRVILVAGCGTAQAARYALRWPKARVVGIDVSAVSIRATAALKRKHGLANLELRQLPIERAGELGAVFDYVVCTGVLHHLPDPDAGLSALGAVIAPGGALNLMVYAPYGRAGVYLLQDYSRRLGIGATKGDIAQLVASLKSLPPDHPLMPLLRNSPDFASEAGVADALLHPRDRSYSVPQLFEFLNRGGFEFGRWLRQAPYRPGCGVLAKSPHRSRLERLSVEEQFAAAELFRGSMVRHSVIAYRNGRPADIDAGFEGDIWSNWTPIRTPGAITVRERLPAGTTAVLINPDHSYTDLYMPIDAGQDRMLALVDGDHTLTQIASRTGGAAAVRDFFKRLWQWDQVVFDASPR